MTAADLATAAPSATLPAVLHLASPMPGLAGYEDFTLTALDETRVLFTLRSAPAGARPVRLFVIHPDTFFPGYAPPIDAEVLASIGADDERAVRLVVVRPGAGGEPPTANLLAPLVVEPVTGRAVQAVLSGDWPLRAPLGQAA